MRAIRGAIDVSANTEEAISHATESLLTEISQRNELSRWEVICIFFTLTPDLNATFPARAARAAGWDVPMLDTVELDVPGGLSCCLRVLLLTARDEAVRHAYLGRARELRPDLEEPP